MQQRKEATNRHCHHSGLIPEEWLQLGGFVRNKRFGFLRKPVTGNAPGFPVSHAKA
jgi:hypothetical protein